MKTRNILTLLFVLAVAAMPALAQRNSYTFGLVDEFGDAVTAAVTYVIYDGSDDSDITASCYTSRTNTTAVDVTNVTGGTLQFYTAVSYVEIKVTHDALGTATLTTGLYPYHHAIMLPKHGGVLGATNYLGTVNGIASNWTGAMTLGADTAGVDFKAFGATTVNYMFWDASDDRLEFVASDILFDDNADAIFGSGLDFTIQSDTAKTLDILPVTTDESSVVVFGADTSGVDLQVFGATTVNYLLFDASDDRLEMVAADIFLDDNADLIFGSDSDFVIESDTATKLEILPLTTDETSTVVLGADTAGVDFQVFGATTVNYLLFDASDDRLEMVAADILFDDNADIILGTGLDFTIECDTNKVLEILPVVLDSTPAINIGVDAAGADLKLFGETTAEYWLWDASADDVIANCNSVLHTTTQTTADQFKVNATGVVVGVAINLETTDGQILLNADGVDNGDILLNAEEDITLTTGDDVTIAITDALTIVSASATLSTGAVTITTTNPGVDFVTNTSKTHKFAYGGIGYVSDSVISTTGICR
ncbi:MAG TPA: hypothetical protein VM118_07410, partial [Acidobacteriota bacterium]|nr:hypothetical protein [Acidobacteriota bacterium]